MYSQDYEYPSYPGSANRAEVHIQSLMMVEVSGYHDQWLRPYQTNINARNLERITDAIGHYNGSVPGNQLSTITREMILPSAYTEKVKGQNKSIQIPNGWGQSRFTFSLVVSVTRNGIETIEMVNGYTDVMDIAKDSRGNVLISPDTLFYINSISTVKTSRKGGRYSGVPLITDSYSVFGGSTGKEPYHGSNVIKMTPDNIIESTDLSGMLDASSFPGSNVQVIEPKMVSFLPTLSSRKNNSPTHYLGKTISAYHRSVELGMNVGMGDYTSITDQARSAIADKGINETEFIYLLSLDKSVMGYTTSFTYRKLCQLDPTIDARAGVTLTNYTSNQNTAPWSAPTIETQTAAIVSNMVTNLMLNYSLTELVFQSTNMMAQSHHYFDSAESVTRVKKIHGLNSQVDYRQVHKMIEEIINEELVPVISANNNIGYELYVNASINLDINITITIDGSQDRDVVFVFPSFADSLNSPMLTTDQQTYNRVTDDIGTILNRVTDRLVDGYISDDPVANRSPSSNLRGDVLTAMGGDFDGVERAPAGIF